MASGCSSSVSCLWVQVLTPFEEARCHVEAWPQYPDALMISNMIAGDILLLLRQVLNIISSVHGKNFLSMGGQSCDRRRTGKGEVFAHSYHSPAQSRSCYKVWISTYFLTSRSLHHARKLPVQPRWLHRLKTRWSQHECKCRLV